jgi:hypothetical protein
MFKATEFRKCYTKLLARENLSCCLPSVTSNLRLYKMYKENDNVNQLKEKCY